MKNHWFKAKEYGWGWYPSTWQGWAVLLLFFIGEVGLFLTFNAGSHSTSATLLNFIPATFSLTLLLIFVCYLTGEPPRWRWGERDDDKNFE